MTGPRQSGEAVWRAIPLLGLALAVGAANPLGADIVVLKDGSSLRNVVTVPTENGTLVVMRSGQVRKYTAHEVLRVRIGPVAWPPGLNRAHVDKIVEKRVAEFLSKEKARQPTEEVRGPVRPSGRRAPGSNQQSILRSAVLPGWGQWAGGRTGRGLAFFGAALGSTLGFLYFRGERNAAEADFRAAVEIGSAANALGSLALPLSFVAFQAGQQAEARVKSSAGRADASLFLLAVAYGWNLLDAGYLNLNWWPPAAGREAGSMGRLWIGITWKL